MTQLALPTPGHWTTPSLTLTALALTSALLLAAWLLQRRTRRKVAGRQPGTPAVKVAALAAVGCTAYSADTSWRFAAHYLDMGSTIERAAMFAAAELALFATALLARQNLNGPKQAPGLPGALTWLITAVQVIPAYAESGPVGGTVRAFVGPVMAALLWHQAMGIELRLRKPEAASHSILARASREIRERVLSRLGIAERDRDAAQITRDRATRKAVALAASLADRTPKQRTNRRGQRTTRRLSRAIARASVGTDHHQRNELLEQLAVRRHAAALSTIELPSPWTELTHPRDTAPPIGPTHPHSPSGSDNTTQSEAATDHPDPDLLPGTPPHLSVQPRLPLHETPPTHKSTAPFPGEEIPVTQRYGRPPAAELEELLPIAREAVAVHGKPTRSVLRDAIHDAGLGIAEDRLTELKRLLRAEHDADTSVPTD